jgi:RHS repeat-associated protein
MPTTTNYIWDEDNLLAEADGTNAIQTVYTNEPQEHGNLVSTRLPVGGTPTTVYHHFDAIGSTRQLTNAAGSVTDTMIYDAWGNVVNRTGTTGANLLWIGEVGYYSDSEIGQFYVRRRPYNPVIARWTTVDPLEFIDSLLRYLYGSNSPIRVSDPNGEQLAKPSVPVTPLPPPPSAPPLSSPPPPVGAPCPGASLTPAATPIAQLSTGIGFDVGYGIYCGFFRAATCLATDKPAKIGPPPAPNPIPIDNLDKACLVHDCCLFTFLDFINPVRQVFCNIPLCNAARNSFVTCAGSPRRAECLVFSQVILHSPFCTGLLAPPVPPFLIP